MKLSSDTRVLLAWAHARVVLWVGLSCLVMVIVDYIVAAGGVIPSIAVEVSLSGLVAIAIAVCSRQSTLYRGLFAALLVFFFGCSLVFWPLSGRKRFVRAAQQVEFGMSRSEVFEVMTGFVNGHPWGMDFPFVSSAAEDGVIWNRNLDRSSRSYDQLIVTFDEKDCVREADILLD